MNKDTTYLYAAMIAALDAGDAIMKVYHTDAEVEWKKDNSPLTIADKNAHAVIRDQLAGTPFPLLSEEGRDIPYGERASWEAYWLVDPLDGTKEFIRKNGEFTVNIALIRNGSPSLGVVYAPALHRFYFAGSSVGSYRLPETEIADARESGFEALIDKSEKLPVAHGGRPFTVVASRSHLSPETQSYVDTLKREHGELAFLSSGSSMKLCLVAEGKADVYPRLAPTMEWDTAAGHAVSMFAGKPVRQFKTGEPLQYNKENLLNPWFVVG